MKFLPALGSDFFSFRIWNPPLFIEDGKGTFYRFWGQILDLNSAGKDPNR
jgi:hypothetical protein